MSLTIELPPDIEQGAEACGMPPAALAGDLLRHALEIQETEEPWTEAERGALDDKIDRALEQSAAGKTYGPRQAREKLTAMREAHLARLGQ